MAATYTVRQVAQLLGYSTNSIYTFLKEERIKGIRVGKGRFRVPQSEIDRLLLTTKKGKSALGGQVLSVPDQGVVLTSTSARAMEPGIEGDVAAFVPLHINPRFHILLPNIFDWFVGTAAFISGLALFLYNPTIDAKLPPLVNALFPALRFILVCAGLGVFFSSLVRDRYAGWHRVFQLLLSAAGFILSWGLFKRGDPDGAALYGILVLVIVISTVIPWDGLYSFLLYISLLNVATIVISLIAPTSEHIVLFLEQTHLSGGTAAAIFAFVGFPVIFGLWWGYKHNRYVAWGLSWVSGCVYVGVAIWFAQISLWSRAFFFLTLALTCLFLPMWPELRRVRGRKEQTLVHAVFWSVFVILAIAVMVVYIIQASAIERTKGDMTNKVNYGKLTLETAIDATKKNLVLAEHNTYLVTAVKKQDTKAMNIESRTIFEANKFLRRIVLLDRNGMGINLYPYGTFDQSNLSFRDYYIAVRETQKPYISDIFEAQTDQSHRKVFVVAVPLLDEQEELVGVLAGSVDLEAIGHELQKIASSQIGEYFVVADSKGNRVMHKDPLLVGQPLSPDDPVRRDIGGGYGGRYGDTSEGKRAVVAYDTIPTLGWTIGLKQPVGETIQFTDTSTMIIFAILIVSTIVSILLLLPVYAAREREKIMIPGGESP